MQKQRGKEANLIISNHYLKKELDQNVSLIWCWKGKHTIITAARTVIHFFMKRLVIFSWRVGFCGHLPWWIIMKKVISTWFLNATLNNKIFCQRYIRQHDWPSFFSYWQKKIRVTRLELVGVDLRRAESRNWSAELCGSSIPINSE